MNSAGDNIANAALMQPFLYCVALTSMATRVSQYLEDVCYIYSKLSIETDIHRDVRSAILVP